MVIEFCLPFIILFIENCVTMTRDALSIEAVGRRANCSINGGDNDYWYNEVIEERPGLVNDRCRTEP